MKTICYLSLGYPTMEKSMAMVDNYFQGGADGVEISIPCPDPFLEKDTIKNWMIQAYKAQSNYDVYLDAIQQLCAKYPGKEFFVMVYREVIEAVGVESFAAFYKRAGISSIISANLSPEIVQSFETQGVNMCSFSGYHKLEESLETCRSCKGFVYMSTYQRPGTQPKPGYETLDRCIQYLRENGVSCPIYCGGGIKTPKDARYVKESGADGYFVGTAIIDLAEDPAALTKRIAEYKAAVE